MRLFARRRRQEPDITASEPLASEEDEVTPVEGERGTGAAQRPPSLQSRLSNLLAFALMATIGLGLLGWYYVNRVGARSNASGAAASSARDNAGAEITLRPLGRVDPPAPLGAFQTLLGEPPEEPPLESPAAVWGPVEETAATAEGSPPGYAPPAPRDSLLERRLAGRAFAAGDSGAVSLADPSSVLGRTEGTVSGDLDALLRPVVAQAVQAQVLPTQRLLLPKGAFLDCTLETAIDSTLPGMTTCILATDAFSADGAVVLFERGTKLVGETRGQMRQGAARLFVLWTEARTPEGVVVPLASPGTDELGRSGLPGSVNRHFFERFGAAILVSVIDGAIQAAVQAQREDGDTMILNPSGSQDVVTEILRSTVGIPPTVVKPQGDRIQVLVARDLDFRSVYELRPVIR